MTNETPAKPANAATPNPNSAKLITKKPRNRGTLTPSLIVTGTVFPAAASISTVGSYILIPGTALSSDFNSIFSILIGVFIGIIAWFISAALYRPYITIKRANVSEYNNLGTAFAKLNSTIEAIQKTGNTETAFLKSACALRDQVGKELQLEPLQESENSIPHQNVGGFRWVNGFGYIYLWRRIHRAEEELINLDTIPSIINIALSDIGRLGSSRIENGAALVNEMREAIKDIEKSSSPELEAKARSTVMRTRNIINVFRDDTLEGILLARKYLFTVTIAMSYLAYILLSLAVIADIPMQSLIAGGVYYLVGAIVGLFTRLNQDAQNQTVLQDQSLSGVRLLYLPMFSGLAAIGGVLVTALLSLSAVHAISPQNTQATATADTVLKLFDLSAFPTGVLIAALFGLSPSLLISRLKQQADAYRADLKSIDGTGKR